MRKFVLFLSVALIGLSANAQLFRNNKWQRYIEHSPVIQPANGAVVRQNNHSHRSGGARSTAHLNSQPIGSAGNLLTIIEDACNQVDVNDSLNSVIFVHRVDPTVLPNSNIAQFAFDESKDRGLTWTNNIGSITDNSAIDNQSVSGRFPQAGIFNPAGNTTVDSAFLVYNGTWHNSPPSGTSGSWQGQMVGRGNLSGDLSSFDVSWSQENGGITAIGTGFTQSARGTFWNINQDFTGTFVSGSPQVTQGILVEKGVWNPTTRDVDWTTTEIPQAFEETTTDNVEQSIATSFNIAFDPTGQYGWIACLGDITSSDNDVYQPIFWKSVDSGATWTGPFQVDLTTVPGVSASLNPEYLDGSSASTLIPSTAFDEDLTVDVNGNPHLLTVIGNGNEYSLEPAGYGVWDISYDQAFPGGWKGKLLANINTLRGTFDNQNPAQTDDNRPLISRTSDGHKIFFFWSETDYTFTGTPDNDVPNLFGRAIDVTDTTITPLYNFTEGDSLWGGETSNTAGGVFGGAIFPTVSPTALVDSGSIYNIPLVLTEIDYQNFVEGQLGSSANPAQFWYVNNINVPVSDFGPDTATVLPPPSGIKEVALQQVSLFPNPSNGQVSLLVEGNTSDFTLSAYNTLGETILSPATYKSGTSKVEMDFSTVESGVYIVKLQSSEGTVIKHLTITR